MDIFKKIKKNLVIRYSNRRPGDVDQVFANNKKIIKILKWKPKFANIEKIMRSAIKWEKKI